MSHHLSNQAWGIELRGLQKLVLLALSHLAVQSTGECPATFQRLAFMCGISDSTVRSAVAELIRAGRVEQRFEGGNRIFCVRVAPQPAGEQA